jgi:hypothetical protein
MSAQRDQPRRSLPPTTAHERAHGPAKASQRTSRQSLPPYLEQRPERVRSTGIDQDQAGRLKAPDRIRTQSSEDVDASAADWRRHADPGGHRDHQPVGVQLDVDRVRARMCASTAQAADRPSRGGSRGQRRKPVVRAASGRQWLIVARQRRGGLAGRRRPRVLLVCRPRVLSVRRAAAAQRDRRDREPRRSRRDQDAAVAGSACWASSISRRSVASSTWAALPPRSSQRHVTSPQRVSRKSSECSGSW